MDSIDIGTKVVAPAGITGALTAAIPPGAKGVVIARRFDGMVEVAFELSGIFGGTRTVNVMVAPGVVVEP